VYILGKIEITTDFIINDIKTKIISGAVHYFRIVPEYWKDTLEDLKDMGCNTVETYIPWNLHEPNEDEFSFDGINDVESFIKLAGEMGLYVIVRPSPYICAEWEFGGLPAWLLKKQNIKFRSNDELFLSLVDKYYSVLLPKLASLQIINGGPIILTQLENEYGSYSSDKEYLSSLYKMFKKYGIEIPVFTSDGTWNEALEAGSLLNSNVFPTGNFGSKPIENMKVLKDFMKRNNIIAPLMCMEFWDGWFNRWGEPIIRRDPKELAESAKEMMQLGSINFYMFHGGTNFGFMNGCSARENKDLPQITSYDYDAILTEWGAKTEKYHLLREIITGKKDILPDKRKTCKYAAAKRNRSVGLFETLDKISNFYHSKWPKTMEELDHYYGYIIYRSSFKGSNPKQRLRVVEASDRVKVFLNQNEIVTQYQEDNGKEIVMNIEPNINNELSILIENLGRVNYGAKLQSPSQSKGIRNGVIIDIHFHSEWDHYCINFDKIEDLDFSKEYKHGAGFHEYIFYIADTPNETFIDCSKFGKGVLFVNGHNCGRFWNTGPVLSLYIPAPFLKKGENKVIIFETEGKFDDKLEFSDKPKYTV